MYDNTQTGDFGKISASSFLYRLTGCRDLDLKAGQQTHMLSQAGKIFLEMTPIIYLHISKNVAKLVQTQPKIFNYKS